MGEVDDPRRRGFAGDNSPEDSGKLVFVAVVGKQEYRLCRFRPDRTCDQSGRQVLRSAWLYFPVQPTTTRVGLNVPQRT